MVRSSALALVVAMAFAVRITSAAEGAAPNVVVFLADDLGWGDLACYPRDPRF